MEVIPANQSSNSTPKTETNSTKMLWSLISLPTKQLSIKSHKSIWLHSSRCLQAFAFTQLSLLAAKCMFSEGQASSQTPIDNRKCGQSIFNLSLQESTKQRGAFPEKEINPWWPFSAEDTFFSMVGNSATNFCVISICTNLKPKPGWLQQTIMNFNCLLFDILQLWAWMIQLFICLAESKKLLIINLKNRLSSSKLTTFTNSKLSRRQHHLWNPIS